MKNIGLAHILECISLFLNKKIVLILLLVFCSSFSITFVKGQESYDYTNQSPLANAGSDYSGIEGTPILFDGSESYDPDGRITIYYWNFGDGEISFEQTVSHTYVEDGDYKATLTVYDNNYASNTDQVSVKVKNTKPQANFSATPMKGNLPLTVTFTDQSTSYDGLISWEWKFGDGQTSTNQNPIHTYNKPGKYNIELKVKENDGDENSIDKKDFIEVIKPNKSPVADSGGPYTATEGENVVFDGSKSYDPDGSITSYYWMFGDGETGSGKTSTHTYRNEGNYQITLTVYDNNEASSEDTETIEVEDANPLADFSASTKSGISPLNVTFTDRSISHDGIIFWSWNLGDNKTSTLQNPTHTYTPGEYTISLMVQEEDGDKNTETKTKFISVEPPPNSPPIVDFIVNSPPNPGINETIAFIDTSKDLDGIISSWSWNFGDNNIATTQNPTHQYKNIGKFTITLTVEDDKGAKSTKESQITIYEINPPITINDYDGLWHNTNFFINLKATDDYSGVAETYYKMNNGATKKLSINGQPQFTSEGNNNTLEYWSVDNVGNKEEHETIINIKLDKTAPSASAGQNQIINEDNVVYFDGQNSDDNMKINNYTWVLLDQTLQQLNGARPQYFFNTPGEYSIKLIVTDSALNSATDTITITVLDTTNPIADAGDDLVINESKMVEFDGTNSYDNVGIVSYVWTFIDSNEIQTLYGVNPSYVFETPETYTITLTVTDAEGNYSNDTKTVMFQDNTAPFIEVEDYATVVENNPITFDASKSYDNIGIINYNWIFGDGKSENTTVPIVEHTFNEPSVYNVELVVTDLAGNEKSAFMSIVVYRDTDGDLTADYQDSDDDNDGMPDEWELIHELNPLDFSDATLDGDGDGINNIQEYHNNFNPNVYDFEEYSLSIILVVAILLAMIGIGIFFSRIQKGAHKTSLF